MKKVVFASIAVALILTGCNTFRGIGQDVSGAGHAVSHTADKAQQKI
ncbi:entericidin A/B family lipoprotein [Acinetobacter sp. HY1485]|nr:entericidin A/B family lipoprotein [Acinetobacter sp. HY1485]